MDVYLDPTWGRHYTREGDGATRWLTDAEEAALRGEPAASRGLFAPARPVGGSARDLTGGFDVLIRRPVVRRLADTATLRAAAAGEPAPVPAPPAPTGRRRPPGLGLSLVAGTLGLAVGLVIGATGFGAGGSETTVQPVIQVPAGSADR